MNGKVWMTGVLVTLFALPAMAQHNTPNADVLKHYVAAQEALAADDFAKVKASLLALAKASAGDLKSLAQRAADAQDIASARKAFKPLSEHLSAMPLPEGYDVAFCPMYDKGSPWVQKSGKIANPYYGASMLRCGEIRKKGGK